VTGDGGAGSNTEDTGSVSMRTTNSSHPTVESVHHHHHDSDPSGCGAGCSRPEHADAHDPSVRTVTLHVDRPLSMVRLRHWLDELLWEQRQEEEGVERSTLPCYFGSAPAHDRCFEEETVGHEEETVSLHYTAPPVPDIFRVKGLLNIEGCSKKWVLQAVHELYDVVEGPEWEVSVEQRRSSYQYRMFRIMVLLHFEPMAKRCQ